MQRTRYTMASLVTHGDAPGYRHVFLEFVDSASGEHHQIAFEGEIVEVLAELLIENIARAYRRSAPLDARNRADLPPHGRALEAALGPHWRLVYDAVTARLPPTTSRR